MTHGEVPAKIVESVLETGSTKPFFPSWTYCKPRNIPGHDVTSGSKEALAHPAWMTRYQVELKATRAQKVGKFSSFLIYSRKNIKHSENIFHIF